MKPRFQADANLNMVILLALAPREPAIDFQTAQFARFKGRTDPQVLVIAAGEGRILATHDHKTMPRHFGNINHVPFSGFLTSSTPPA